MQTCNDGDSPHEYRPYYSTGRNGFGNEPVVSAFPRTHHGIYSEGCSLGGGEPDFQRGLGASPRHKPYFATTPQILNMGNTYSGNSWHQGVANGYSPVGWPVQQTIPRRSQECGTSDVMQSGTDQLLGPTQPYFDAILSYGSNTGWRPSEPSQHMSVPFKGSSNFPFQASSFTCAKCQKHPHIDGDLVLLPVQGDVDSSTDCSLQATMKYLLRPNENNVPSNRQLPTQEGRRKDLYNEDLDGSSPEQANTGLSLRKSNAVNASGNLVTVLADQDDANRRLIKKRKRKPKMTKPRKPRTLTDEGKAHAKAIRECPGGACEDCKRKKTKVRDPSMNAFGSNAPLTVNSAPTGYRRTYARNRRISGPQTLQGLSP